MKQIVLYTYGISQSSEKVRWALDYAGVPYKEKRLAPFVHRPLNATMTGELLSPMPVLVGDGETISDSTKILEWLSVHRAPFSVIPRDPSVRIDVMNCESRFDHAAVHLLRWTYAGLLKEHELALRLWSIDANPLQSIALHAGFRLIRYVFERGVGFEPSQLERSRRAIDRVVQELNAAADGGKTILVGQSLSAADITAAALLAPLACPDEHPLYSRNDYRSAMKSVFKPWERQPGLDWVRATYRKFRQIRVNEFVATAPLTESS